MSDTLLSNIIELKNNINGGNVQSINRETFHNVFSKEISDKEHLYSLFGLDLETLDSIDKISKLSNLDSASAINLATFLYDLQGLLERVSDKSKYENSSKTGDIIELTVQSTALLFKANDLITKYEDPSQDVDMDDLSAFYLNTISFIDSFSNVFISEKLDDFLEIDSFLKKIPLIGTIASIADFLFVKFDLTFPGLNESIKVQSERHLNDAHNNYDNIIDQNIAISKGEHVSGLLSYLKKFMTENGNTDLFKNNTFLNSALSEILLNNNNLYLDEKTNNYFWEYVDSINDKINLLNEFNKFSEDTNGYSDDSYKKRLEKEGVLNNIVEVVNKNFLDLQAFLDKHPIDNISSENIDVHDFHDWFYSFDISNTKYQTLESVIKETVCIDVFNRIKEEIFYEEKDIGFITQYLKVGIDSLGVQDKLHEVLNKINDFYKGLNEDYFNNNHIEILNKINENFNTLVPNIENSPNLTYDFVDFELNLDIFENNLINAFLRIQLNITQIHLTTSLMQSLKIF